MDIVKILIYIGVIVGCVFAVFVGFAIGGSIFDGNIFGRIIGLGVAGLMILGLGYIGKGSGVL